MNCPYTELELMVASVSCNNKINKIIEEKGEGAVDAQMQEIMVRVGPANGTKQQIADFHQIPLEMLINSPNYDKLCNEHMLSQTNKMIKELQTAFGLSDKEAWAALLQSAGLI